MEKERIFDMREFKKEAEYLELERLSKKLGIPVPMVHLKVKSELHGKVTGLYEGRARTWTRNYWNALFAPLCGINPVVTNFGAGYISIKQTSGTVAAINQPDYLAQPPFGPVSNSTRGIIPGRGTTAESFESHVLATPITHGTGANQLGFRLSTQSASYNAGTLVWTGTLTRLFDNTSGGSIVVTETGIYAFSTGLSLTFMNCRDLLASSVTVLNNGVLTIIYTITLTFPA